MNSRKKEPTRGNLTKDQIKQLTDIALELAIAEAKYKSISRILKEHNVMYDGLDPMFMHERNSNTFFDISNKTEELETDNKEKALIEYEAMLKSYQQLATQLGIKNSQKIYKTAKIDNYKKGDEYDNFPHPHESQHEDTIDQEGFIEEFKSELYKTRHVSFIIDKPAPKVPTYADMVNRKP